MWRSVWQTRSWPLFCQAKWEGGQWMPFCILELLHEKLVNSDLNRKWKIWALRLHTELSLLCLTSCRALCSDRGSVVSSQRNAQTTKSPPRLDDSKEGSCSWITLSSAILSSLPSSLFLSYSLKLQKKVCWKFGGWKWPPVPAGLSWQEVGENTEKVEKSCFIKDIKLWMHNH